MSVKNPKILLAKPGLDGHDVGVKVLGHAMVDAGFKVVYSGLRKSVEEIVQLAIDKQVDVIALSILSGTHLVICGQMAEEMLKKDFSIPWIVGGNIPDSDVDALKSIGAKAAFPTGTTINEVLEYCNNIV